MTQNRDIYKENGYKNRQEYLESLADESGESLINIMAIADMLGEEEDFDGLVSSLDLF